jgi:hypothetical protein
MRVYTTRVHAASTGAGRQMAAVLKKVSTGQGQPDVGTQVFVYVLRGFLLTCVVRDTADGFRQLAEMQHGTEQRFQSIVARMWCVRTRKK